MSLRSQSSVDTIPDAAAEAARTLTGAEGLIYCRQASVGQSASTLQRQEALCRRYLSQAGIDTSGYAVVHEGGVGGSQVPPTLKRVLERVGVGGFTVLAVADLARISRSSDAIGFVREFVRRGGRVFFARERIRTDDAGEADALRADAAFHAHSLKVLLRFVRDGQNTAVRERQS